jgi:hypothetical protein
MLVKGGVDFLEPAEELAVGEGQIDEDHLGGGRGTRWRLRVAASCSMSLKFTGKVK